MITGAASGIGAATALRFARAGYVVAIGNFDASTRESAETVAAACRDAGSDTLIFDADVGSDADCRAAVASVTRRFGRLDALVNCAGTTKVITHDAFDQLEANEFERV